MRLKRSDTRHAYLALNALKNTYALRNEEIVKPESEVPKSRPKGLGLGLGPGLDNCLKSRIVEESKYHQTVESAPIL